MTPIYFIRLVASIAATAVGDVIPYTHFPDERIASCLAPFPFPPPPTAVMVVHARFPSPFFSPFPTVNIGVTN